MKITKEELLKIVSLCWTVSGEADLGEVPAGMVLPNTGGSLSTVRWTTFQILLSHLVPTFAVTDGKVSSDMRVISNKEPWQE